MESGGEGDRSNALQENRRAEIRKNNERLRSLGIPALVADINKHHNTVPQQHKNKRSLEETIPQSTRVLRSQSAMPVEDVAKDMPTEQMEQEELNLDDQLKKKNGRKRTRMHNVYDRANQPPVRVDYNAEGQPVGNNATEFSNFLSTVVKSQIPFQHEDWRNADVTTKNDLMTILRVGNPCLDGNGNTKGRVDYFWSHGVMSDEVYANVSKHCNFDDNSGDTLAACSGAFQAFDEGQIDPYNIYSPICVDAPNGGYYPSGYGRH